MDEAENRRERTPQDGESQITTDTVETEPVTAAPPEEGREESPTLPEGEPRVDLSLRLTEAEILTCLKYGANRRAGRGRLITQSVLLVLMAAYCIGGFFLSGMQSVPSLLIGVAALAVMAAMLAVPELMLRSSAKKEAAQEKCLRLRAYDEGLYFGSEETDRFAYADCRAQEVENLLLLRFQGGILVGIPRRLTDEAGWDYLKAHLLNETDEAGK